MNDQTLWLYRGRVGHDAAEGPCSCGGRHSLEDEIEVGTKTVSVQDESAGGVRTITLHESIQEREKPWASSR